MIIRLLLFGLIYLCWMGCGNSQAPGVPESDSKPALEETVQERTPSSPIHVEPGRYKANVNLDMVPDSMRVFSRVSEVFFGLEENNRFVYSVNAMGRKMDDVGKWVIQNDSLYIFDLENGPNTRFKIEDNNNGTFNIYGPNNFVLVKEEVIQPTKN